MVTEAGFGADLGAEKFMNIKCRKANLKPSCVVIVATIRALKMHGGVEKEDLKKENIEALKKGLVNLERHINNVKKFGVETVVAINHFITDTENEINVLKEYCNSIGIKVSKSTHWSDGGEGAKALAQNVVEICEKSNQDNFINCLQFIFNGEYITEKRMALKVSINNNSDLTHYSLNDIVIDNGSSPRTLEMHVYISDHFLNTYILTVKSSRQKILIINCIHRNCRRR